MLNGRRTHATAAPAFAPWLTPHELVYLPSAHVPRETAAPVGVASGKCTHVDGESSSMINTPNARGLRTITRALRVSHT